jgi:lipopolysaccharide heptosyltransferase II
MAPVNWEKTLVLQTSFLGDTVLTLPLIAEVRRRFPVKHLSVLCLPSSGELLQGHPAIDQIIVDDKKAANRGWLGMRRTAVRLMPEKFTAALTPHKSLRSALILYLAGISHRVGFRESRGWFLFHQRAMRDPALHDVERNLSVLRVFGLAPEQCQRALDLPISPSTRDGVNQKLRNLGVNDTDPIVGVSPGSVWPTKRWSTAGFARLIRMLRQRQGYQILLFGGVEDGAVVQDVLRRSGAAAVNLVQQIGLRELAAAIDRCHVFVTNDSGPMHVAVARRVPTVAVFCATTPDLGFYPYTDNAIVVQRNLPCRPCASHGGRRCPLGTEACIQEISAEVVVSAVEKLLGGGRRGREPNSFQPELLTV